MSCDHVIRSRFVVAFIVAALALVLSDESFARRAPHTAACSAEPAEVTEGEPIKLSATGSNFNAKHLLTYAWTTDGGKLEAAGTQNTTIDTTGIKAGSYTANATITDSRQKKNSAACATNFTVRAKPMNPPQVSCSVSPPIVQTGMPVTITATVTSPDGVPISTVSYRASAGRVTGSGNIATEDTTGVRPGSVTATVNATDNRNLTGTGSCSFMVEAAPHVINIASIQFPDSKSPWLIDDAAKLILSDVGNRLKADPNARIAIIGYAGQEPASTEGAGNTGRPIDRAAQRAVNAKAYLVQQQGIDPGRIDVRTGSGKSEIADIDWIPQGSDVAGARVLQGTIHVNELAVRPTGGQ